MLSVVGVSAFRWTPWDLEFEYLRSEQDQYMPKHPEASSRIYWIQLSFQKALFLETLKEH